MITFENIETKEIVTFTGEEEVNMRNAHMAAYLNSSNLGINAGVRGQDAGWRLAPEIVAEMDAVRNDFETLDRISRRIGIGVGDIRDFHILSYVADKEFAKDAKQNPVASNREENEEDYRARVKAAKQRDISHSIEETSNAILEVPTKKEK